MRLHTRLFVGTALLVLAVLGVQLLLQVHQLRRIELGLGEVATTVGKAVLELPYVTSRATWIAAPPGRLSEDERHGVGRTVTWTAVGQDPEGIDGEREMLVLGSIPDPPPPPPVDDNSERTIARAEAVIRKPSPEVLTRMLEKQLQELEAERATWRHAEAERTTEAAREAIERLRREVAEVHRDAAKTARNQARTARQAVEMRVDLKVVRDRTNRMLVIRGVPGGEETIPLPVTDTIDLVRSNVRHGVLAGGGLLLLGLVGAAVIARRVAHPLSGLAEGARRVGAGELGVTVPVSGPGEVADLERAFNDMSQRLTELEAERERWRAREHLAELGNVARGLAHTLRNPLNTLGLAVDELAGQPEDRQRLTETAHGQIRRIDRWLRSFLAVSAGNEASFQVEDVRALVQDAAFEAGQRSTEVVVASMDRPLPARCVPQAARAALMNLLDNAVDASPEGASVDVDAETHDGEVRIRIADRGPGLPETVRRQLFSPHVTTKPAGSGMGLFLARQLIAGLHGGRLTVRDRDGGGTVAEVALPAASADGADA